MAVWKPASTIRVKVLALVWRGDSLLLGEVEDSAGRVVGVRPLGGSVEFGESREAALRRELHEELGCAATFSGPWHLFENIYRHEGAVGHEFLFAINTALANACLYRTERVAYVEGGARLSAIWHPPHRLPSGVVLYPAGLADAIAAGVVAPGPSRIGQD